MVLHPFALGFARSASIVEFWRKKKIMALRMNHVQKHVAVCKKCGCCLGSRVVLTDFDYYHVECFRCAKCDVRVPASASTVKNGIIFCRKCDAGTPPPSETDVICQACNEKILDQSCKAVSDRFYHGRCFKCAECGSTITSTQYYVLDEKPYCLKCYAITSDQNQKGTPSESIPVEKPETVDEKSETAYTCYACKEPFVTPDAKEMMGRLYHEECLQCERCDSTFNDENKSYVIDDKVTCINCYWIIVASKRAQRAKEKASS